MLSNPSHLAYVAMSPVLSTMLVVLNLVTIYIFYGKFRLSSLSLIIIVNISACDIFVCLISNTFYVVNLIHPVHFWSTGPIACKLFKFSTMMTNIAQIYFLCFLNADRLRRLTKSSVKQWEKKHGRLLVCIGWVAALLISVPRLVLFDEKVKQPRLSLTKQNSTGVAIHMCKPVGMDTQGYTITIIVTFVLAYALPACYILYSLVACQLFMWKRRTQIHISSMSNTVTKMHSKLAFTFNLTGALFMAVWTPFFVLSLLDLNKNISNKDVNINFSLRCTLLILGSAKPLIYMICLDKFRRCFSVRPNNSVVSGSVSDTYGRKLKTSSTDADVTQISNSKY